MEYTVKRNTLELARTAHSIRAPNFLPKPDLNALLRSVPTNTKLPHFGE